MACTRKFSHEEIAEGRNGAAVLVLLVTLATAVYIWRTTAKR